MSRYGLVVDLDKCTACGSCAVACSAENNVDPADPERAAQGRAIRWLRFLRNLEGEFPNVRATLSPVMCQQCERPPCVFVCPVSATYLNPEGIVAQVYWRCIGCRYCVSACPYTIKSFNWWKPAFTDETARGANPDVSVRTKGVTEKCNLCHHRLQLARERAAEEGRPESEAKYAPACVEACPTGAIVFGDLDDPSSEAARLKADARAFHMLEELGTKPKVTYLKEA